MTARSWTTHHFGESDLIGRESLSGVEYDRMVREMDANFQAALRAAFQRGEFPGQAMRDAA